MSTHAIEIVSIDNIEPHPNADKMELTRVWGWQCCIGKGQFSIGDKAVYVPPDYTVPSTRPEFAFLKKDGRERERITVRRFRQQLSQGLLIPLPQELSEMPVGSDVMDALGIERYEPPMHFDKDQFVAGPENVYAPKFDVEAYQRYAELFTAGEPVVVTEKIHGANARYVWRNGELFVGSRTNWMADTKNPWRLALAGCPQIAEWCEAHPEVILYGEVFGNVQELKYGCGGQTLFAAFAILDHQRWLDYQEAIESLAAHGVPSVPLLYRGPFDLKLIQELAEGDSRWPGAKHMAEGVVVLPEKERFDPNVGRVCLKIVSNRYLIG